MHSFRNRNQFIVVSESKTVANEPTFNRKSTLRIVASVAQFGKQIKSIGRREVLVHRHRKCAECHTHTLTHMSLLIAHIRTSKCNGKIYEDDADDDDHDEDCNFSCRAII